MWPKRIRVEPARVQPSGYTPTRLRSQVPTRVRKNYSPNMTFYDVRTSDSSDSFDPPSTTEQSRKIRRPSPDEDDISSLGSYTITKPIPKMDKTVDELILQHEYEIKSLRAEVADQRRLQTEVSSVGHRARLSRGTITVPRQERRDEPFLRRSFMIYPDKINSTLNHLHLLTYALCIRRTRLGITNPGVTVPPSPVTHRA